MASYSLRFRHRYIKSKYIDRNTCMCSFTIQCNLYKNINILSIKDSRGFCLMIASTCTGVQLLLVDLRVSVLGTLLFFLCNLLLRAFLITIYIMILNNLSLLPGLH